MDRALHPPEGNVQCKRLPGKRRSRRKPQIETFPAEASTRTPISGCWSESSRRS